MTTKDLVSVAVTAEDVPFGLKCRPRRASVGNLACWRSGCLTLLLWAATTSISHAQTFTSLASFNGSDGSQPENISLAQGVDGNLYGTTGSNVFMITPAGSLSSVANLTDGFFSTASLILATDLNLYGTTEEGGAHNGGTIFKVAPDGTLTTVYSFCSQPNCADGDQSDSGLFQASNGSLYGTTQLDGAGNSGTIFKITLGGKLTTLYSFCPQDNCTVTGSGTGLVQATTGDFYGSTIFSMFKMTPAGEFTTLLTSESSNAIASALVQANDGNFYGTAVSGGNNSRNAGTLFRLTPAGVMTTLYNFCSVFVGGSCLDGVAPYASLIQATDGNLYGTTLDGGAKSGGTIFKITLDGKLTTLYSFCAQTNCDDGEWPLGGLVQSTNGTFYGTTWGGGTENYGTVFSLSTGLGPFVRTLPLSAGVGKPVTILGTDLSGATSVKFNGKPSAFTVVSSSEITTTVPIGATAGSVTVTTPSGTLTSNVPFLLSTALIATTTTLTSSPNPSTSGEIVTFTAMVSSDAGPPPSGETVSFMHGTTVLGTSTLTNGSATFTTSTLPVGTSFVKAEYGTDAYFKKSVSTAVKQVVDKAN